MEGKTLKKQVRYDISKDRFFDISEIEIDIPIRLRKLCGTMGAVISASVTSVLVHARLM